MTSTAPGRTYTATAWVKAGSAASVGKTAQLKLHERAAGGAQVADVGSHTVTLTSSWQQITVTRMTTSSGGPSGCGSATAARSPSILNADAISLVLS